MKKIMALIGLVVLSLSCDLKGPCIEISVGPPYFTVEILDKTSNENVFTNGTYKQNQLEVNTESSTSGSYMFISENNRNVIGITPSLQEGTFTTTIILNNQITIPIKTIIVERYSSCHANTFIESVIVNGYSFTYDESTGIYKIKI